ncbi:DEAD/DEAH box helicase [Bradyrhizobium diazoefficiens]|uniref:DEAD/DEAH box helicase n=1 Tax=Bradyrhizobium diazoefficiens TaxID=1355477 RepID=UPI003595F677
MAFKSAPPPEAVPDSPEKILLELPRRKIPGVLLHQGQMMQKYVAVAQGAPDVALQLPTGSGKTLVGLLIGEWLRRKNNERVVFLCPTRQLVNQVVEQAETQYGLSVHGFVGSKHSFDAAAKADYQAARRIAVTTYSGLFNTNPFFDSPNVIIADDAHTAENYIASMWSLRILRREATHAALHEALSNLFRPFLDATDFGRLTGQIDGGLVDLAWVEKLPTPAFAAIAAEFAAIIDQHVGPIEDLPFRWAVLRDNLQACHVYLTPQEILLRPLIPPTWTHAPFVQARQRIFMSATLGEGGDLERLTGRPNILRLPVPEGWDRQGIGRRFFIFPDMALTADETVHLRRTLMSRVPRSMVLVPNDRMAQEIATDAQTQLGLRVFDADAIENFKSNFVTSQGAVAILANRYDGIDFPGDECRLLFLDGLPKTTNAQERFFVERMGAYALLQGRIQTRVVQAVGRCTRSLQDFSAVVVTGSELTDYLNSPLRLSFLHPELQAELDFGARQSTNTPLRDLVENFDIFMRNDASWEAVNRQILAKRATAAQAVPSGVGQLQAVVTAEINYQKNLWQRHYEGAVENAGQVLAGLTDTSLQGYRALWNYLAGAAAAYGEAAGVAALGTRARIHFAVSRDSARSIRWLAGLARFRPEVAAASPENDALQAQIERLESHLLRLGTAHDAKYTRKEKSIQDGLNSKETKQFEIAHRDLGEMLGFQAGRHEADATPDPWWIAGKYCVVFEDHSGAVATSALGADKARQAAGHPKWMHANNALTGIANDCQILSILVTPVTRAETGAFPHLPGVALWPLDQFKAWAMTALSDVRNLRRTLGGDGDLVWRAEAAALFEQKGYDAGGLLRQLAAWKAVELLKR